MKSLLATPRGLFIPASWSDCLLDSESVISKIESVLEEQVDVLLDQTGSMSVTLKMPPKRQGNGKSITERQYRFPGKTAEEAWRFSIEDASLVCCG